MTEKSIALGTFDGFHLGHTAVMNEALKSRFSPYVLLFSQHPMSVFASSAPPELLTKTIRSKLTDSMNISPLIIDFQEICNIEPEDFFTEIIIKDFNAKELSCGENYTFGKNGRGNVKMLKQLCSDYNIKLNIAPTQIFKGDVISSTKIRSCIENGNIEDANKMLGRAFSYDFTVVSGDKRGRILGFPTINQFFPDEFVKMKFGVYASAVFVDGAFHAAVTNFGVRPTIGTNSLRSETCILNFSGDLYGENIEVEVLSYLRAEKKFENLDLLTQQINSDALKSQEIFNNHLALLH